MIPLRLQRIIVIGHLEGIDSVGRDQFVVFVVPAKEPHVRTGIGRNHNLRGVFPPFGIFRQIVIILIGLQEHKAMLITVTEDMHGKRVQLESSFKSDVLIPHHVLVVFGTGKQIVPVIPTDEGISLVRLDRYVDVGIVRILSVSGDCSSLGHVGCDCQFDRLGINGLENHAVSYGNGLQLIPVFVKYLFAVVFPAPERPAVFNTVEEENILA